ncbi:MAG: hypothetical protein K2P75_03755 [Sphingobacteriaceae bacterium]|nr:hypothetical protein [Sphingobacteriaceae bacterium]
MKRLELQNFGVLELDAREMREIDGGGIILGPLNALKELAGTVGGWVSDIAHGIVDGFKDGAK